MKKNLLLLGALCFGSWSFSQVGINTKIPQSKMDVTAKAGAKDKDGLQAPDLSGKSHDAHKNDRSGVNCKNIELIQINTAKISFCF